MLLDRESSLIQVMTWCRKDSFELDRVYIIIAPDSKVHGANMGPTWVLSAPDGPRVGPMNLAIRGGIYGAYYVGNLNKHKCGLHDVI